MSFPVGTRVSTIRDASTDLGVLTAIRVRIDA